MWTADDPGIVTLSAPGQFDAAGIGDTFVRAGWRSAFGQRTVSVFAGLPPLPTAAIVGSVFEAGKTAATGAIEGARVEVIGGILAGRTATTGVPPSLPPGFVAVMGGPGQYRLLGVPPGTYRVRVSRAGYTTAERDVTVSSGDAAADFQLVPAVM